MSKYANKWQNGNGQIVTSESRPDEYSYPVVAMSRVSGSSYRPYAIGIGSAAWRKAANETLDSHARSNFETKGR